MPGDPDTAVEPPEIADNAATRARPHSSLTVSSAQGAERPEVSAEVPASRPDMDVPAEDASHGPTVGQFRVFKPPAGVSTWDSSPFIESPFIEASAPARRDRLPLLDGAGQRPRRPRLAAQPWPLLAVLLVQAALSLRLTWSNTAFQDEALYLRAGHLEWARWLHNTPIPNFPAYFSGAPVLYPPLGALADSVGGLTAARLLSLGFMLGVTTLLWATTARLYGQRAALLATALFATLAGTQFLGAFATYDAMALFLLALAAWLGVRCADCQGWTRAILLITTGVLLAAADAVKYATALFTPVVIVVVAMTVWRKRGGSAGTYGRPDRARLMAPGGHRGHHRRRPGLLAGHHHEHPDPAAVERSGHRGASPGLRVDEPDPGPGRPGCGAVLSQGSTRGTSWFPSWRPLACSPRPSRPGCTRRSACRSTSCSGPGSPPSPPGMRWPG